MANEKVVEAIVLKVGLDAGGLERQAAGAAQAVDDTEKKVKKLKKTLSGGSKEFKKLSSEVGRADGKAKKLTTDVFKLKKGFDGLAGSIKKSTAAAKKWKNSPLRKGIKGLAVVGAAVAIHSVTKRIEELNQAGQDSVRLSITREELLKLQGVARKFGATSENMVQGLKNIAESASEALTDPKGSKGKFFKALKIDAEKFIKLAPEKQIEVMSKSFANLATNAQRTEAKLLLMGEEGFKLSLTMDELAVNARGAKDEIESANSALSPERIQKMNVRLSKLNDHLRVLKDHAIAIALAPLDFKEDFIEAAALATLGLNKAQEEYIRLTNDAILLGNKNVRELRKQRAERAKGIKDDIRLQKERDQLVKEGLDEIDKQAKDREGRFDSIANVEFRKEQKIAKERQKAALDKKKREEKAIATEIKRRARELDSAKKAISAIALTRKKDLITELKENQARSKIGGAGVVRAGSAEAQQIDASLESRDSSAGRIKRLTKEVKTEESAIQKESLETAKKSLKQLEELNKKKPLTLTTRGIN